MSVINRKDLVSDEAFKSIDELGKKLANIATIGKKAQTSLTGKGVKKITTETKKLTAAEVELAKITKQVNTAKAKQSDEYVKQQKEVINLRKKQKELVDESGRELGTVEKLTKRNKELRETRNRLNLSTEQGRKRLKSINTELDKNNKRLKNSNDQLGKQKINIGNYQSALGGLPGPLGGAVRATQALTSASLKFMLTPIGAVIAALALAVGTLTTFFKGSEEGQNKWNKITSLASVIFGNFKDIVIDIGKGIFKLINLDFKGAKEAFGEAASGVKNFVSESVKELKIQNELSDLRAKNIKLQRTLTVEEGRLIRKSFELREQAAEFEETNAAKSVQLIRQAIQIQDELASKREEVARNNFIIAREEAKLSESTTETLDEVAQKERTLEDIQATRAKKTKALIKELNALEKKAVTQAKANVEITKKALTDIEGLQPDIESQLDLWVPDSDGLQNRIDKNIELYKAGQKKIDEINKEAEDTRKAERDDLIAASVDTSKQIFGDFTQLRIEQIQQELTAIEFARNRELELAGENQRQKIAINKKFDDERRKLEKKQLDATKANALFQIAINIAVGVAKTIANLGLPAAIPFIIATGLAGISQAAVVFAQKPPELDEGKEHTPKDYIAGEKRPELRKSKGKWSLVNKPTLFTDSPGDKIVSGKETDSILGNMADLAGHNLLTDKGGILSLLNNELRIEKRHDSNLAYVLEKNNADLIRTIKNKKEVNIKVRNANVTERSGNRIIHRIDYYYSR